MNNSETVITLTKIKQWYLPVDAESYMVLRDAGVPLVRIHENFIPTLGLLTKKKIRARTVDFNETILHPYLDNLGAVWQKREHRKAMINNSVLRFETTHASVYEKSKQSLDKLESSLRRFFTRWGYSAVFETSESRGKLRLHVSYKHDSTRLPIIPLIEDPTSLPVIRIDIGFVRISMTLGEKEVETNISIASGPKWTSIQTSRCLYSQITDVRPMVSALMQIVNKEPLNFETPIK